MCCSASVSGAASEQCRSVCNPFLPSCTLPCQILRFFCHCVWIFIITVLVGYGSPLTNVGKGTIQTNHLALFPVIQVKRSRRGSFSQDLECSWAVPQLTGSRPETLELSISISWLGWCIRVLDASGLGGGWVFFCYRCSKTFFACFSST